jgi:hypothetical protein
MYFLRKVIGEMKDMIRRFGVPLLLLSLGLVWLGGCASLYTRISKGELRVESQMSDTVFLDPLSPADRIVFVDVRNTTGKTGLDSVHGTLLGVFQRRGYEVTTDPTKARVMVQVNFLSMERTSEGAARSALDGGYGSPAGFELGALGAAIGSGGNDKNTTGAVGGALLGGLIGTLFDANTHDVTYAMVSDIQLSMRSDKDLTYKGKQNLSQGSSGSEVVKYDRKLPWIRYRTRVVTTANKVNLELNEAVPAMSGDLANTLGGLL